MKSAVNGHIVDYSAKKGSTDLLLRRSLHLAPAVTLFFKHNPVHVVKAQGQYLIGPGGEVNLDCISNVQHVGHGHARVAEAISQQFKESTCNSRFLNDKLVVCCEKLKSTLPVELDTVFFCNSGSEANDLSLRIAYDFTNEAHDIIVLDHAYHGHVTSLIDISPYKFNGKGGRGKPNYVHVAPCPDVFRGKYRLPVEKLNDLNSLLEMANLYAHEVRTIFETCKKQDKRIRCFIAESLQSCGGQVIPPPTYFEKVSKICHEFGALFIADEVQTGFGRVGSKFWAFQLHDDDFIPDIVTMGKPMGNGFPVSATVTKRSIAEKFGNGMEYFNTFGGNPVACAACLAVFEVLEKEKLMDNARLVGEYLLKKLKEMQNSYPSIGDIRGAGLFLGIDMVNDLNERKPASELAYKIISEMRIRNILLSVDGPDSNVIKIKPPLCFNMQNADHVLLNLNQVLDELTNLSN